MSWREWQGITVSSSRRGTAAAAAPTVSSGTMRAVLGIPGGGRRHEHATCVVRSRITVRRTGPAGLPPGTGSIHARLGVRCQVTQLRDSRAHESGAAGTDSTAETGERPSTAVPRRRTAPGPTGCGGHTARRPAGVGAVPGQRGGRPYRADVRVRGAVRGGLCVLARPPVRPPSSSHVRRRAAHARREAAALLPGPAAVREVLPGKSTTSLAFHFAVGCGERQNR